LTAIATFTFDGCPLVFGDLLLSGPTPAVAPDVRVPAIGSVADFFGDSGWSILGLQQKVVIVDDRCALAWAGSWLGARVAIAAVREAATTAPLSADRVHEVLEGVSELRSHPADFVGLVAEGETIAFIARGDILVDCWLPWGLVTSAGSGRQRLRRSLRIQPATAMPLGGVNGIRSAVSFALQFAGQLLTLERRQGDAAVTLRELFGGGYEIAAYDPGQGRFCKLPPETTYVFWEAATDGNEAGLSPVLLIKKRYIRDVLAIRSLRLEMIGQGQLRAFDDQRHAILPMYECTNLPSIEELNATKLHSELYCHSVLIHSSGAESRIFSSIVHEGIPAVRPSMRIQEQGGEILIEPTPELLRGIAQAVEASLR
jgi:hypothetical protein